jgi:hypothetical protein
MVFKVDMQGIEIEVNEVNKTTGIEKGHYNDPHGLNEVVGSGNLWHPDDGKSEFSSKPFHTLGEMEEHLIKYVGPALEHMSKEVIPITMGCTPFFSDFASAHVHTSVKGMSNSTWVMLRQKLCSFQPFIALLSQNSPIVNALRAADVRLFLSNWAILTDYDSVNEAHWMAIAYGQNGATIEVRLPSSGPMHQALAVANFIRVALEEDIDPLPVPNINYNFDNVIKYGSSSLTKIALPKASLRIDGIARKSVLLKTTDLFKIFYEDNKPLFEEGLKTMSNQCAEEVRKFYNFIAEGHTLSDSIYDIVADMFQTNRDNEIAPWLSKLMTASYSNKSIWSELPTKPKPFMPVLEKYYSVEEVIKSLDVAKANTIADRIRGIQKDELEIFLNKDGLIYNSNFRTLMYDISTRGVITQKNYSGISKKLLDNMVEHNILTKISEEKYSAGENFAFIASIARDGGFV